MSQPQIAVIGTGFIGPVHVEALRRLGLSVRGILGSSPDRSQQAATALRIEKAYPNFESLLADDEITVVHIASPNDLHKQQAIACIEKGKHVVCEKPLAMSTSEAERMLEVATKHPQQVCAVNYNIRFYPMVLQAKAMIEAGELGDLIHIGGSYLQDWLLYDTDFNWRVLADRSGPLRVMGDVGSHWLDLIQFVSGQKIESVFADLSTYHRQRYRPSDNSGQTFTKAEGRQKGEAIEITTEDFGSLLLRFDGGTRGNMTGSQVAAGRKNEVSFEIYGTQASLRWNSERPDELLFGQRDVSNQWLQRNPAQLHPAAAAHSDYPAGHAEGFPDSFKQLYRAVYNDIDHGRPSTSPLYATFQDGLSEMRLLDAIAKSNHQQNWQQV